MWYSCSQILRRNYHSHTNFFLCLSVCKCAWSTHCQVQLKTENNLHDTWKQGSHRWEGFCSSALDALLCFLRILHVELCYHLIHVAHAEGWTVLHGSYQTLACCISVREKALSHLAFWVVQPVHHKLAEMTFSRVDSLLLKNVPLLLIGVLFVYIHFVPVSFSFLHSLSLL